METKKSAFDYESSIYGRVAVEKAMPFMGSFDRGEREYFSFRIMNRQRQEGHDEPNRRDFIECRFYDIDETYLGCCFVDANDPFVAINDHLLLTHEDMRLNPTVDTRDDEELSSIKGNGRLFLEDVDFGEPIKAEMSFLKQVFFGFDKEELRGIFLEGLIHDRANDSDKSVDEIRDILVSNGIMTKDYTEQYRKVSQRRSHLRAELVRVEELQERGLEQVYH